MAEGTFNLGKASLDLSVDMGGFQRNMQAGKGEADRMQTALDSLAAVSKIAEDALKNVKMGAGQAAETDATIDRIEGSVGRIGRAAVDAADHLGRVKMTAAQAAESDAAGDVIDRKLKDITGNANEARRSLESVRLASAGNPGVGVGPFGSGFGRIGLLGTAVAGGVLTAPTAAPAALGLLAALPALAGAGAGALGVLALAFQGVVSAIGGNKKAFDALQPSQKQFVETVRSLTGELHTLEQTAAKATFPGLTAGLKAALSPETLRAITEAVNEFGTAIGHTGEEWGRYFGSSEFTQIFGPLMAEGAHDLQLLSDAALHLTDAVGVLGRAGIPLTEWITEAIDKGSRLADVWLHDKDATGGLSGAMTEAHTALQLVAGLVESLGRAVGALGVALYPVSKVAVKDLTDGLNALAAIINRNQGEIRDIVGGALSALVATVKTLYPIVATLARDLDAVAHAVGGWKTVFEIVLAGFLAAKFVTLAGSVAGFATKIALIGTDAETAAAGAGGLRAALLGLGAPEVLAALAAVAGAVAGIEFLKSQAGHIVSQEGNTVTLDNGKTYALGAGRVSGTNTGPGSGVDQSTIPNGVSGAAEAAAKAAHGQEQTASNAAAAAAAANPANMATGKSKLLAFAQAALGKPYLWGGSGPNSFDCSGLVMWAFSNGLGIQLPHSTYDQAVMGAQVNPSKAGVGDVVFTNYGENGLAGPGHEGLIVGFDKSGQPIIEAAPHTGSKVQTYSGYQAFTGGGKFTVRNLAVSANANTSPFGPEPPFTKNLGPAAPKPPAPPVIPTLATLLKGRAGVNAANASTLGNVGGTAKRYLTDELTDLNAEYDQLNKAYEKAHGKAKTELKTAMDGVQAKIVQVQALVKKSVLVIGDALLPEALRTKLAAADKRFTADSDYAASLTGQAADSYQATLVGDLMAKAGILTQEQSALKLRLAASTGKQKQAVQDELTKVTASLSDVDNQILGDLQQRVSALQGRVGTAFQAVSGELTAQFDAQTQSLVAAAAAKFFQNGAQTPLEKQLADMQAQDQLQSLQDAVSQATDAPTRAAAQRQLDEYNLSIQAAAERAKADSDYAAAVQKIQTDRAAAEAKLTAKLSSLANQFQNGTATMADLSLVAEQYGLQIDTSTIPDFADLSDSVTGLSTAFADLAAFIGKITGVTPKIPTGSDAATLAAVTARAIATAAAALPGNIRRPGVQLASGGIVLPRPGGTVATLAEAGVPELVAPLTAGVLRNLGGGQPIVVNVSGVVGNEAEVASRIGRELQKLNDRGVRFGIR